MNTLKLLPREFRFIGLAIVIPLILAFFYNPEIVYGDLHLPLMEEPDNAFTFSVPAFLDQSEVDLNPEKKFVLFSWIKNDLSNEILLTLMLLGTYFIAFAKIKSEDEFSGQLRLQSMVSAIVWNSIILLVANFLVYDGVFLYIMILQLFSFLLIFSIVFALKVRKFRKGLGYEE